VKQVETCLQKNKFKLDLISTLRIIRISQLGTMPVLTAQLKPDFRPSKCLEFVYFETTQGTQRLWMSSEFKSGEGIRILIGQNSDGNS